MNSSSKNRRQKQALHAMLNYSMKGLCFRVGLLLIAGSFPAFAQLGSVWHVPSETRPSLAYPSTMRDPLTPLTNASVTFYQGVYKATGGNNQTGGTLYYRFGGGTWQTTALNWHANEAADAGGNFSQFWKSTITMPSTVGTLVEYYFAINLNSNRNIHLYLQITKLHLL